jgi:hypothetical protein
MGNVTAKDVGQFQIETGRIESKKQLFGTWFFGIVLIIIGCVCVYYSFKPTSQMSCYSNDEEMRVNEACSPMNTNDDKDKECQDAKDALDKKKQMCSVKKPKRVLLFGALLIPLAILMIMYAIWNDKIVQKNDFAAIGKATRSEIEMASRNGLGIGFGTGFGTGLLDRRNIRDSFL